MNDYSSRKIAPLFLSSKQTRRVKLKCRLLFKLKSRNLTFTFGRGRDTPRRLAISSTASFNPSSWQRISSCLLSRIWILVEDSCDWTPWIVRNPCEKSINQHRLLENPRVKENTLCSNRRLKPNGLPPFLNSSGSSLESYTCTLAAVQPFLRNKLADDTWKLQG